jgi:hypothetical protein
MNQAVLNRARKDKFLFVLDIPNALKRIQDPVLQTSYNADPIEFTIIGSPVPKISVPSKEVPFGGQVYHISSLSRPSYGPFNVNFFLDNGYQNYWTLWNWLNLLNDNNTSSSQLTEINNGYISNPMSDYTSSFTIYTLDEFNNKLMSFKYTQAFITGLSEFNFSYQEPGEISCTASFAFNQLQVELLKNINIPSC